ncbi:MAG: hypothetical protein HQK67_05730, partial [Desulfamplus sp.]|nr:hypothetical protein [Desulfamplus sp.]
SQLSENVISGKIENTATEEAKIKKLLIQEGKTEQLSIEEGNAENLLIEESKAKNISIEEGKAKNFSSEESLSAIVKIIRTLRGENGCSWDKKQTPETMWKCLAEEMYELLAAIEADDSDEICEELGDVLFQLVFIAEIYREKGSFDIKKSIAKSAAKMIRRHPHIYGKSVINSDEELWASWESIKKEEKEEKRKQEKSRIEEQESKKEEKESNKEAKENRKEKKKDQDEKENFSENKTVSVLDSVPTGMPALMRSYKISERAVRAGFDWKDIDEVIEKASEEWNEFTVALAEGNKKDIQMEFGDVLFTLANVARLAGIHPEIALSGSTVKFEKRFKYMEQKLAEKGYSLKDVPRQDLEVLWEKAKEQVYDSYC